jgi:hypothetical protein
MLETCSTIKEAIAFFQDHCSPRRSAYGGPPSRITSLARRR